MSDLETVAEYRVTRDNHDQPMPFKTSDRARARIREEMARKNLNQTDLANLLKWTQSRMSKILNGRTEMGVDELSELAWAAGISMTEIVRDHGLEFCAEMTPTELRFLERLRQLTPDMRDAYLKTMAVHINTRAEDRRATKEKKMPRGRG